MRLEKCAARFFVDLVLKKRYNNSHIYDNNSVYIREGLFDKYDIMYDAYMRTSACNIAGSNSIEYVAYPC